MSRRRYIAWNAAMPTTVADVGYYTTGTIVNPTGSTLPLATLMQIKAPSNIAIIEWGYQTSVVPTAIVNMELLTTSTVGATMTAYVAADLVKYDDAGSGISAVALATTSGFAPATATNVEGSYTVSRYLDQGPGWSQFYCKQFPLDREPGVQTADFVRIRGYSATAIGVKCYIVWEE